MPMRMYLPYFEETCTDQELQEQPIRVSFDQPSTQLLLDLCVLVFHSYAHHKEWKQSGNGTWLHINGCHTRPWEYLLESPYFHTTGCSALRRLRNSVCSTI
jgi:hypothetical protein